MVTSDFRPEVEIRPFRACAMKNTQYNAYLWPNGRNLRILKEIGVEEHDGDVRYETGMHPAIIIGTVRSLIVDVAMGQIPRSTERISSFTFSIAFSFQNITDPSCFLYHLFSPPRDTSVLSRSRTITRFARPVSRTKNIAPLLITP